MADRKKRLTAKRKFEIYLETRAEDAPVGEILRKHGLHLSDLRSIEQTVEQSAMEALKRKKTAKADVTLKANEYNALLQELQVKEKALSDITVEYTLLKKKTPWTSRIPPAQAHRRGDEESDPRSDLGGVRQRPSAL